MSENPLLVDIGSPVHVVVGKLSVWLDLFKATDCVVELDDVGSSSVRHELDVEDLMVQRFVVY